MLQHVALTVNDSEEIEKFYEDVLLFRHGYKFSLKDKIAREIFNVTGTTDVYKMVQMDVQLEIFLSSKKENKVFSHICLAYPDPEKIYHKAVDRGCKTFVKKNPVKNTFFIWDQSGNLFELKYSEL